MDLFREIADMINPVKNAQILDKMKMKYDFQSQLTGSTNVLAQEWLKSDSQMRLYTIKLGYREYETTDLNEALLFISVFGCLNKFVMRSKPYTGPEIQKVINTKQ